MNNLKDVKIGQPVYSSLYGHGIVTNKEYSENYPVFVCFGKVMSSYTLDGYQNTKHKIQTLFLEEPKKTKVELLIDKANKILSIKKPFKNAKTGHVVYSTLYGWGNVIENNPKNKYPIRVLFTELGKVETFSYKGFMTEQHIKQTLFWRKR